jgi:multicomponent Na+:H+ antiporter subunit B
MAEQNLAGMTIIVKTVTRITLGFLLLYGIYIGTSGHVAPGGGVAGGVIIALSLVHIMLAFGKKVALEKLHSGTLRSAVCVGALLFLFGIATGKGLEFGPVSEMLLIGAGLFAIFTALVLLSKGDRDSE